jgi:hypothetical protein
MALFHPSSTNPTPKITPTPGDILVVKFGDIVPADVKILGDEEDEEEIPMQVGGLEVGEC